MKTTPELEAEILRLHHAEHWPPGTIATQLGAHVDQVHRVLGLDQPRAPSSLRPRLIDPYRPFIDETLQRYPKLRATRLYDMVRDRGFEGSVRTVREHVAIVRPRPPREAYLVTETLPGEVAQVDWAHVGEIAVPGGVRALWMFVMVFAYSRAMWGEFVIDLTVHSLCRSLVRAARALGGVTRQWLFDNPKVVVLERIGTVARFHPTLLALCAAMRVEPKLCAVRAPRQKGKVERAIRYLRDRFLAGRTITGVEQGNRLLAQFIAEIAHVRPHPTIAQRTVGEVFAVERPRLLALPEPLPETARIEPIKVDSQAFIHLDTNRYSVPSDYASRIVTLVVDDRTSDSSMVTNSLPTTLGPGAAARSSRSPSIVRPSWTSAVRHATSRVAIASAPWSPRSTASSSAGTSPARALATASRAPSSCSISTATRCSPPPPRT
jgi:transposase